MTDRIDDSEILYHAVPDNPQNLLRDVDGTIVFTSMAFADRMNRPSVDRAALANFKPQDTQRDSTDFVLSLVAGKVRQIYETRSDNKGNVIQIYAADVESVGLPDNSAHAEIFGQPPFDNDKVFRRICYALIRISRIETTP